MFDILLRGLLRKISEMLVVPEPETSKYGVEVTDSLEVGHRRAIVFTIFLGSLQK